MSVASKERPFRVAGRAMADDSIHAFGAFEEDQKGLVSIGCDALPRAEERLGRACALRLRKDGFTR
jgi:hypothetical protein